MHDYGSVIDVLKEGKEYNLFKNEWCRNVHDEVVESVYRHFEKLSGGDERALQGLREELVELGAEFSTYKAFYGEESEKIVNRDRFREMFWSSASRKGYNELLYLLVKTITLTEGGDKDIDCQAVTTDAQVQTTTAQKYVACYAMMVSYPPLPEESEDRIVKYVGHIKMNPNDPFEINDIRLYTASPGVMEKDEIEDKLGCPYQDIWCLIKKAAKRGSFYPGEEVPIYKYIENQIKNKLGRDMFEWIEKFTLKKLKEALPSPVFTPSYSKNNYPREVW